MVTLVTIAAGYVAWCLISKGSFMPNLNSTPCKSKKFTDNNLVANIGPCNRHLVLKQCPSFSQSFHPSFARTRCSNKLSLSANQFNCSSNLIRKFVSFDWRAHQTQSNKNRICSNNWSSCNACISLVKAGTLFEYQLRIVWSNIASKHVWGLTAVPIAT